MKPKNPSIHRGNFCTAGAAALALAALSISTASAEVIAGWDNFTGTGAVDPVEAPVLATGVTASFVTTTEQLAWNTVDERGASSDGTWGTNVGPPSASTVADVDGSNLELPNATTGGTITMTITNGSGADIELDSFHFDSYAFRPKAARTFELSVLPGGALPEGVIFTSDDNAILVGNANNGNGVDINFDIELTGVLEDTTLEDGGTVEFLLQLSGGAGDGSGGHDLWIDNLAVTSSSADANRLTVTVAPASATAGEDFSVTVEAQDGSGTPLAEGVSQDTVILLTATGLEGSEGVLSGNTATITAGTNSVVLPALQYTVAEDITLVASQVSGDLLAPSGDSTTVTINAGPASVLSVEFSNDPAVNDPVGNVSFRISDPLDTLEVFAIARDSVGNFISWEEGASFSLVNLTGEMMASDLVDNGDGSATFTAAALGTANIRASATGLPDGDSGLITVEEPQFRWTGGDGSWGSAANWLDGISPYPAEPPAEPRPLDLFFYDEYTSPTQIFLGGNRTARTLNFTQFVDPVGTQGLGFGIRFRSSNAPLANPDAIGARDLTLDTDLEAPVEINVAAGAEANINLGNVNNNFIPDTDDNYGDLVLADPLKITHLGTGNLIFSRPVAETGGSMGVTIDATSTGTVVYQGANTYTGPTTVNGGILRLTGDSIADNATLVIDGGIVDVAADERMVGLTIGGEVKPDGQYGGPDSGLENPEAALTGTGIITVGPAPLPPAGIVVTDIAFTGDDEVTITFTSETNVDVYGSTIKGGFEWNLFEENVEPGVWVDTLAFTDQTFYILVTTGDPAPPDSP